MYSPQRASRSEFATLRHLNYHLRTWGTPSASQPPLVMVHGWMDVSASFQFVVDALAQDRHIVAPDWRGYGLTDWPRNDGYWFADYLADLDAIIDHIAPDQPVDLLGHSMGGNVAMLYSGVRPERVRKLINLEGFGMPATRPAQAPGRLARWMDELKALHRGDTVLRPYASADGVARRLMKTNPRLTQDKADWLARHWARETASGEWEILGDPAHKLTNPQLYRVEEVLEIYRRITAPVLAVDASDNSLEKWWNGQYTLAEYYERLKAVPTLQTAHIHDAGHMLHHDQPVAVAQAVTAFLA